MGYSRICQTTGRGDSLRQWTSPVSGPHGGSRGRSAPLPAAMFNIACAGLATQQWLKPAPANDRETLHNAARDGDGRAVAGKLLGLAAASLSGYRAKVCSPWRWRRSLPRGPVSPLPLPLGNPRSSI